MISGTFWAWWYAGAAIWCLVAIILWGIRDEMEKDFSDNTIGWEIVWPIALVAAVIVVTLMAVTYPFICLGRYIGRMFRAT